LALSENMSTGEAERGWSRASLRIFGETLQPHEIAEELGLEATHSHLKGERHSRGRAVWRESAWLLQSPLGKESDLAEHLRWLVDCLEPKLDVIKKLSGEYRVDLFCGFSSGCGQGGFTLDGSMLERIAGLGVPLALDLYPPIRSEDSEVVDAV
jgi:hypothetical protein